jgi:ferritin-like protein
VYDLYGCAGAFLKNLKNEIQGGIAALVEIQKTNFRNYTYNPDNPYTWA